MKQQIFTGTLDPAALSSELAFVVAYFRDKGLVHCEVLFGWAWGNRYYPGWHWRGERLPLSEVESKVRELEAAGLGLLGEDDVFIRLPHLELQLCHDSDLHLGFDRPSEDTEFFFERWQSLGYRPIQSTRSVSSEA